MITVLEKLKKLRNEKGISQQVLADIIGVSQQSINKYENHNVEPDILTLISIADYFDVSVDYLIGRFDNCDVLPIKLKDKEKSLVVNYRKLSECEKTCIDVLIETYIKNK